LEKKVFRMPKKYHENNFSRYCFMRNSGEASPGIQFQADSSAELTDADFKYV